MKEGDMLPPEQRKQQPQATKWAGEAWRTAGLGLAHGMHSKGVMATKQHTNPDGTTVSYECGNNVRLGDYSYIPGVK